MLTTRLSWVSRLAVSTAMATATVACAGAPPTASEAFPLSKGSTWTYRAALKEKPVHEAEREKTIAWTMAVVDVAHQGPTTIALVKGFPEDAKDRMAADGPQTSAIVMDAGFSGGRVYRLVDPPMAQDLWQHIASRSTAWRGVVAEHGRTILEMPLKIGEGFASERVSAPRAGFDSWNVTSTLPARLEGVKGDVPPDALTEFILSRGLNKSETTVGFVPGIGIVSYTYEGYAGVPPDEATWSGSFTLTEWHRGRP
jgi:hypothetical protein